MEITIIDRMCSIAGKMGGNSRNGMSFDLMEKAASDIDVLGNELGLSPIQTVLLIAITCKDSLYTITGQTLATSLGISYLKYLSYNKELETLQKKGYIRINKKRELSIPQRVLKSLINNKPVEPEPTTGLDAMSLLVHIKKGLDLLEDGQCSTDEIVEDLNSLMELNPHNSVSKTILRISKKLSYREIVVLYGMVYRYYFQDDDMVGWHDMEGYFSDEILARLRLEFKLERLTLQKERVLEYAGRNIFMERDYFKLSDEVKEEIFDDVGGIKKQEKKITASRKVVASEITPKTLFYNQTEQRQVEQLKELMSEKRFNEIRVKMKDKGFRTGFTCLFYGGPGTGKTETAYQIARESGRDLYIVDVSQIKSCWVGESEKNIKNVFEKYREAVKAGGVIPILLFNEADAIFGIRREGAEKAVDKMENSIQNIILQELEDLDGILIATTNLTTNLDKAFERRFLYKICFEMPSREARASIWRAMLPSLSIEEAEMLAKDYDFSGGQIENIVRKREIKSIIDTSDPGFNEILDFCSEEIINSNATRRKIGF
jgi:SpoVK/Ycf46/Vps4 family AAA+-type ATPase